MIVKDVKELKLNNQIWIDLKANNEVSSGEALKRMKLFEYSNLIPLSISITSFLESLSIHMVRETIEK